MKLHEIGERRLTYGVTDRFSIPFDDCAWMDAGDDYLLVTTDMVGRKTHFPEGATFYQMGWYAVAVNASDIAAKGGTPAAYVAAMGLPRNLEERAYRELLEGMGDCMEHHGGVLVGGDTKEADDIIMAITALGRVKKNELMKRKGARPGDEVWVTGTLGRGGAALLEHDMDALLMVEARVKEGRVLAASGNVTSCMDLSDGLAASLHQLMKINACGFKIYEGALPVDGRAQKREDARELVLYYGGDYELLFTACKGSMEGLKHRMQVTKIGEVMEEQRVLLIADGSEEEMENRGYEHFR